MIEHFAKCMGTLLLNSLQVECWKGVSHITLWTMTEHSGRNDHLSIRCTKRVVLLKKLVAAESRQLQPRLLCRKPAYKLSCPSPHRSCWQQHQHVISGAHSSAHGSFLQEAN